MYLFLGDRAPLLAIRAVDHRTRTERSFPEKIRRTRLRPLQRSGLLHVPGRLAGRRNCGRRNPAWREMLRLECPQLPAAPFSAPHPTAALPGWSPAADCSASNETPAIAPAHPSGILLPGNRLETPSSSIPSQKSSAVRQTAASRPCAVDLQIV